MKIVTRLHNIILELERSEAGEIIVTLTTPAVKAFEQEVLQELGTTLAQTIDAHLALKGLL